MNGEIIMKIPPSGSHLQSSMYNMILIFIKISVYLYTGYKMEGKRPKYYSVYL